MKNVDKLFSLKLINLKQESKKFKYNNSSKDRSIANQGTTTELLDKKVKSAISRSNEDLIETETEEMDRSEDTRLAEEAMAANLKLLKKQKARFLRLQRILSRNVFLIPLCAVFSVLSAASIFAATLTDYYEHINYDIIELRKTIDLENNRTLAQLNQNSNLNHSRFSELSKQIKSSISESTFLPSIKASTTTTTTTTINPITSPHLKQIYIYDLINLKDHYVITRRNAMSNDNSTLKTNIVYQTYAGIWRVCNYLSGKIMS